MKYLFSILVLFPFLVAAQTQEKEAIQQVIQEAYVEGLFNKGDVAAIRKGFHEQFMLLGRKENNHLRSLTRDEWIKIVEQKKAAGKYPPADAYKVKVEFLRIDIVEEVASVKLAFYEGEKLAYIDFLALYKFEEGWEIMNKVYHTMPE